MHDVYLLLLLAGFVCFVLAVTKIAEKVNFIGLGLAFWVAVPLIVTIRTG